MIIDVRKAVELLNDGKVVAIPTETVYGLAARIDRSTAIEKIFSTKERPFFDPLIVHVSSINQAQALTKEWNEIAEQLAKSFWPGPLTLVLPKATTIDSMITSGLETVGLRFPSHLLALEIIRQTGPLAAPSANKFGRTSPTVALDVDEEFLKAVPVVDGGPCEVGVESTILSIESNKIKMLRPGLILKSQILECLNSTKTDFQWNSSESAAKVSSPGSMLHHYMPEVPLVLLMRDYSDEQLGLVLLERFSKIPDEEDGVKLKKPRKIEKMGEVLLSNDPRIAAREFYAQLREVSRSHPDVLLIRWQENWTEEAWSPVIDRMKKAATLMLS